MLDAAELRIKSVKVNKEVQMLEQVEVMHRAAILQHGLWMSAPMKKAQKAIYPISLFYDADFREAVDEHRLMYGECLLDSEKLGRCD